MTIKTLTDDPGNLQADVALVGAGMIAQTHVSALSAACRLARLVTVVSRHPDRARHLSQYYDGPPPKFVSDLFCVLHDPRVQVVIVATPPSVRIELIRALSAAGKNILLEKPVARNVNEAEQVVQICERAGVKLGVLFQHRMRLSSQAAKRLLLDGTLGKLGHIEIAVPLWREQSYYDELERGTYARDGGGVLITQAIHSMDLALSLAGPVTRVQAMTATTPLHRMEAEDFAVAGLQFASGAVGSLVASTATYPHGCESITIHCSEGSIRLEAEVLRISWRDGRSEQYPPIETCEEQRSNTPKHEWHQSVIEDFIIAVKQDRKPMVTGHEALAAHRLIEAIELSSSEGVAVDLPL